MSLQRPVVAFPMQDHLAHIQVHLDFLSNPILGMGQLIGPQLIPGMLQHIKEHMVYWYSTYLYEKTSDMVGMPLERFLEGKDKDVSAEVDRVLAMASQRFMPDVDQSLQGVPPVIQQAQQFLQQLRPPRPEDPSKLLMAETQRKAQYDQGKLEIEKARVSRETQLDQIKMEERRAEIQAKLQMNREDNMTAKELAVFEAEHGQKIGLSTGHGINPGV
jgi:hypothetical protein